MFEVTTNTIATQGNFDKASDRIIAIATQGHFLYMVNVLSQSISITKYGGGITICKTDSNVIISS